MNDSILKKLTERFAEQGFTLALAPEIEFYIEGGAITDALKDECYEQFGKAGILSFEIVPEEAEHHHEIALVPINDPSVAAENLLKVKDIIRKTAKKHKLTARFDAKPYPEKPGSGLHIHVSILCNGKNLFEKKGDEPETEDMLHAIGGLCATMPEAMIYFAPTEESYARFTSSINTTQEGISRHNNAPVTVSWGGNNRTTAIRIPASTIDPSLRHIEHRVAGADADPVQVIGAVLAGIYHGITQKVTPPERTYGNAYDAQYNLPLLPKDIDEAKHYFEKGTILRTYLTAG
ncbi:MAG: glutamine synthetase [Proteobacteria bacterium]|nr:glutamine synthetase [Pseudomonadota bacterium]